MARRIPLGHVLTLRKLIEAQGPTPWSGYGARWTKVKLHLQPEDYTAQSSWWQQARVIADELERRKACG